MRARVPPRAAHAYHHGDLKNALIQTALDQIAKHGPRALSLREVARATGVSHASTYRHFPNKESVLASIAEQGFRNLTAALAAVVLALEDEPAKRLQATGVAYVNFGVSHPHHMQVMFGDCIASHDAYPTLIEASAEAYEVLAAVIREGQRLGRVNPQSERLVALTAWATVHGLAMLIASGRIRTEGTTPLDHEAIATSVTALLQSGLGIKKS